MSTMNDRSHAQRERESAAPAPPALVLIVDDDPGIRGVLTDVLEDEGYVTVEAANGEEALAFLDGGGGGAGAADVILLDMRMPVMNGWQFAAAYRERAGPRAPIIVMTAAQDAQRWADEIGAAACVAKPFEIDTVVRAIEAHRGERRRATTV